MSQPQHRERSIRRIVGIDPGSVRVGFGIIDTVRPTPRVVRFGVLPVHSRDRAGRLSEIERGLTRLIRDHVPTCAVLEEVYFDRNRKTALQVSEARGVILSTLYRSRIRIIEVSPPRVKQIVTGYGRADKNQVQRVVQMLLALKALPQPDDAADALALALCGMALTCFPSSLPSS
ncbi:MAG: crossover junction endodeoxyribonuclease RuvC [Parcubacteria group bacterium]|nr:crossover junction endodeoxyribonuclease RuvC [Parcubacteria group bacterium]